MFGYVVTDCTWIGTSLDSRFSLSVSVSVSGYIIDKSACMIICVSLDSYFFVSPSFWMRVAVSDCRWKCTLLDSCFSECFYPCSSILKLILVGESINTSVGPRLSPLSLCLCQCPSILSVICMYVSKRVQLTQWATALWKIEFWFFNFACIRTSLDFCFFLSLFVWMSVPVSSYIMTHCMCICFSS